MFRHVLLCSLWLAIVGCSSGGTAGGAQDAYGENLDADVGAHTSSDVVADGLVCAPGSSQCIGSNFLRCNDKGTDWEVTTCGPGTRCTKDGCIQTACMPNNARCNDQGLVEVCLPDGSGYGKPTNCPKGTVCKSGLCVPERCTEGEKTCTQTSILVCKDGAWVEEPCREGQICFKENCIDCFSDEHCPQGTKCIDGVCTTPALTIITAELPDGQVGKQYDATIEAEGGTPPYSWAVATGNLPSGSQIAKENDTSAKISGTPTTQGKFSFEVEAKDQQGALARKQFEVVVHGPGLTITSKSPLPDAEDGSPYSFQFKATGGVEPYGWMILSGSLPKGLAFSYTGELSGTPEGPNTYSFKVRVVDSGDPVQQATSDFALTVKIAPLKIVGDQMVDLFLTKVVILPLITVVQGIPIPYSTQLQAKGGLKPYHWKEVEIPSFLKTFIPKAGIPQGLTLSDSGTLSGAVTSTDQVIQLNIPFVNFTLTGFFFMAQVTDSQDPPASDQAIFLIPTVPVNLGGGGGGGLPF